jgi:hypothetical protein
MARYENTPSCGDPLVVDTRETRRQLGNMSRSELYELLKNGELKSIVIGRKRLIFMTSIRNYVEKLAQKQGQ